MLLCSIIYLYNESKLANGVRSFEVEDVLKLRFHRYASIVVLSWGIYGNGNQSNVLWKNSKRGHYNSQIYAYVWLCFFSFSFSFLPEIDYSFLPGYLLTVAVTTIHDTSFTSSILHAFFCMITFWFFKFFFVSSHPIYSMKSQIKNECFANVVFLSKCVEFYISIKKANSPTAVLPKFPTLLLWSLSTGATISILFPLDNVFRTLTTRLSSRQYWWWC